MSLQPVTNRSHPLLAVFMTAFLFLSGCQSLQENKSIVFLGLDQATLRVIERADDRRHYAERIVEIAGDARSFVDANETATVDAVIDIVRAQIKWEKLGLADRRLVEQLIVIASEEIKKRVDVGLIKNSDRVFVAQALTVIEQSAMYWLDQNPIDA